MKLKITFTFDGALELPQHYNHIVQAIIYKWINDDNYRKFLHDSGYNYQKRTFKLFTFSKLFGSFTLDRSRGKICFHDRCYLYLSSMDEKLLIYLSNGLMDSEAVDFCGKKVFVNSIELIQEKAQSSLEVYTISPITVASTVDIGEKKKTYYYNPSESEFQELIARNLIKKYIAYYDEEPKDTDFKITRINNRLKENIIKYKNFIIKGWSGEFKIEGSKELIDIALKSGLGSKNSQGFGCIMIKNN